MIRLLEKFLFPALMLIASIEVLFCNSHDVAPRDWVVVVGATTLLICSCLEYVIPQNPEWNYFTREKGMRWWVLGRDSTSFAFASTLTDAVRFSLCIWVVGTLSPLFGPRLMASVPKIAQLVLLSVGIELSRYWVHRAQHRFMPLWRFHSTHHMMQGFTALRTMWTHPLDDVMFYAPELVFVLALGFDPKMAAIFWSLNTAIQFCNHSNLNMEAGWLGKVFMHQKYHIHHHSLGVGAKDSVNFGEALTLWDRVFGTFRTGPVPLQFQLGIEPKKVRSGLHQMFAPLTRPISQL